MEQLQDFSALRAPADAGGPPPTIPIPLNGEVYHAQAEVEADVMLAATGALTGESAKALADLMRRQQAGEDLDKDPAAALAGAAAGMEATSRSIKFLLNALVPESRERWIAAMAPYPDPPIAPTGVETVELAAHAQRMAEWEQGRAAHERRKITLPQVRAVYQALLARYSGRPTTPSQSSPTSSGATGGTSTVGAPAAV